MDSRNPTGAVTRAGVMHMTSIRVDVETWDRATIEARRRGLSRAAFIRDAIRDELTRTVERDHIAHASFGAELNGLHERVRRIEHWIGGRR
jgi:hypothetical protein